MKKSYDIVKGIVSIVVVIFSISGCIGKGKDTIHLSAHEMTVNADAQTVTVTTEGDRWWYDAVYYSTDDGGKEVVSEVLGKLDFDGLWFTVTDSEDHKSIYVNLQKNETGKDRYVRVSVWEGDFFDSFTVTQRSE